MRLRSASLIIAIGLIGLPVSAASAARAPVLGAADGVQAVKDGKDVVIHFTGSAAGALQGVSDGDEASVTCTDYPAPGLGLGDVSGGGSFNANAKVAGHGTELRAVDVSGDVCEVRRPETDGDAPPLARVALTPAGNVWLDAFAHATQLLDAVVVGRPTTVYRPAADVVADGAGQIVALAGPDAVPPPNQVGYWTDGGRRATYTTLTGSGRTLVLEDLGGGMTRTNLDEFQSAYVPPTGAARTTINSASDADPGQPPHYGNRVTARDGLRASVAGGRLTVRFAGRSARMVRKAAGRRVSVLCGEDVLDGLLGAPATTVAASKAFDQEIVRVPRRGSVLRVHVRNAADLCSIEDGGAILASFGPTARGRRWLTQIDAALALVIAVPDKGIAVAGATAYPSTAAVVAKHPGLVALSGPDAPVAQGKVGVWTDGAQRALLARTLPSGVRGVWADDGNGVVRSNVLSLAGVGFFLLGSFG
ncbi:MAG TPA: hypothetical protein VGM33_20455 [Baekduia sp.]|jgi:hypothetical protein